MTVHKPGAPIEDVRERWPPEREYVNRPDPTKRRVNEAKDEALEKEYPEKSE